MKIQPKYFFYIMISVIVLSFGGIIGAFYWGNKQLVNKGVVLSELRTDSDIAQAKIVALNKAQKSSELTETAEKLLSTLLPNQKQQEKLVADILYTASTEAGIPIENIGSINFTGGGEPSDLSGTEQSNEVPGVYTYPFSISVSNISYDTLLLLLKEIENNGRLVQVDSLQISPDKLKIGQISDVSLSLKAFLKP
jgi:Tfp pilus assembly protein PilO